MSRTNTIPKKKQHGNTKFWNLENSYPIKVLVEHNITEIRGMNALEKNKDIPILVQKILEWGTNSPESAIGTLEIVKDHFIRLADENN